MMLNKKYIIGTHIMFYEIDMVGEFIESIIQAIKPVKNRKNITIDLEFNLSEVFEKIDTKAISKEKLTEKFYTIVDPIKKIGCEYNISIYDGTLPKTMVDYRRDLNYFRCQDHDYVIWGESDCLIPFQTFEILDYLATAAEQQNIFNYVVTFAMRKMWDESWKILEHNDFTELPYYGIGDEPEKATQSPHSIRYTMSLKEMNSINSKVEDLDIRMIDKPKFDGSCLVLSSNLIKAGANIPPGFFGLAAEDTAFMYSCLTVLGNNYRQFVVKNILKVHNRVHPLKRKYVAGDIKDHYNPRENNKKYHSIRKLNKDNLTRIFNNKKILSYKDWEYFNT
jgi:hypothetical protein